MSHYSILVFLHVASVIVWLGAGTTVALITLYALRARDPLLLDRVGGLTGWLVPRVFAPAALSSLGFGLAAAHEGHWPRLFFFHVGEAAYAVSFLIAVAFRAPLLRRARRGAIHPARLARVTLALAIAESTVLYLAVADMVAKPTSSQTTTLAVGGSILALAAVASLAIAFSGPRPTALAAAEVRR